MKQSIFIAAVILSIVLASCQQGEKTAESGEKYFRQLKFSESAYDKYAGMHEISAKEANDINHYRFSYAEDGLLVELRFDAQMDPL